jgi:hypothetical protein
MWKWLHSLPDWLKPILVTLGIGAIATVSSMFTKHIYAQILVDLDEAHIRLARATGSAKSPGLVVIPEEKILKAVWWPAWLVKRARNYQKRKQKLKSLC